MNHSDLTDVLLEMIEADDRKRKRGVIRKPEKFRDRANRRFSKRFKMAARKLGKV